MNQKKVFLKFTYYFFIVFFLGICGYSLFSLFGDTNEAKAATVWYLDKNNPNAADTADAGTAIKPFATLVYAYSKISTGDTIYVVGPTGVDPVVYNENARIVATKCFSVIGQGTDPEDIMFTFNNTSHMIVPNNTTGCTTMFQNVGFTIGGGDGVTTPATQAAGFQPSTGDQNFLLDNVYILSNASQYVLIGVAGLDDVTIQNSTIVVNTGGFFKDVNNVDYTIDNNDITITDGAVMNGIIFQNNAATSGGIVTITNNDIVDNAGMVPISLTLGGHASVVIEGNDITAATDSTRTFIELVNHSAYSVKTNSLLSTSVAIDSGIIIRSPGAVTTTAYVQNNTIDTYGMSKYSIRVGGEGAVSDHYPDSLAGSVISGNIIYSGDYHGVEGADTQHNIMVGNNKNCLIYDNVVHNGAYGVVVKGSEAWTSGGVYNNKFIENTATGIRIKGPQNVQVYGNSIIADSASGDCMNVSENTGPISTGTIFHDNYCSVVTGQAITIQNDGSEVGIDFYDNTYYLGANATRFGSIDGVDYDTLVEWQAATSEDTGSLSRILTFDVNHAVTVSGEPTVTGFTTGNGSTNFTTTVDLTSVANMKLANSSGYIQWSNAVNVLSENYDNLVRIGTNFVSVDATNADSTLDAPATVYIAVNGCDPIPTIYYATGFYNSAAQIVTAGQVCNANTTPACTNISCSGITLTFTVPHFDSYATQQITSSASSASLAATPEVEKFIINNGSAITDSREVTLFFDVKNATDMAISNTEDFVIAPLIRYSSPIKWTLTEGVGEKTVYVKFRSASGNATEVSRKITYTPYATLGEIQAEEPIKEKVIEEIKEEIVEEKTEEVINVVCPLEVEKAYKATESSAVYYLTADCKKRIFTSEEVYFSYYDSWKSVGITEKSVLESIPDSTEGKMLLGPRYTLLNGSLIKTQNSSQVYYVLNGKKHWITTIEVLNSLGLNSKNIIDVSPELLEKYGNDENISNENVQIPGIIFHYTNEEKIFILRQDKENTEKLKAILIDDSDWTEVYSFLEENVLIFSRE